MDTIKTFGDSVARICLAVLIIATTTASMAGMLALPNSKPLSERPADAIEHTIDSLTAIGELTQDEHAFPTP